MSKQKSDKRDISLQPPQLSDYSNSSLPRDFTFYIDKSEYRCISTQIYSISEAIYQVILEKQRPIFSYRFKTLKDPIKLFQSFIDSLDGKEIQIDESNAFFFNKIADELRIPQLKQATKPFMNYKLSPSNALTIFGLMAQHNIVDEDVLKYVTKNWDNVFCNDEKVKHLPPNAYKILFKQKEVSNKIHSFSLLNWIISKRDIKFRKLFKYADIQFLNNKQVAHIINGISIDKLPNNILQIIKNRFLSDVKDNPLDASDLLDQDIIDACNAVKGSNESVPTSEQIERRIIISDSKQNSGIFHYFPDFSKHFEVNCGGGKGTIMNLFNYENVFESSWSVKNTADEILSWFSVISLDYYIIIHRYSLSYKQEEKTNRYFGPRSWKLDGCVKIESDPSKIEWEEVSLIRSCEDFKQTNTITFPINKHKYYRGFKLSLYQNNVKGTSQFWNYYELHGFEIFGTLIPCK